VSRLGAKSKLKVGFAGGGNQWDLMVEYKSFIGANSDFLAVGAGKPLRMRIE
jgi:hypothetical protein